LALLPIECQQHRRIHSRLESLIWNTIKKYYPEPVPEVSDHAEDIDLEFWMEDLPKADPI
jgi:hypothetical protein